MLQGAVWSSHFGVCLKAASYLQETLKAWIFRPGPQHSRIKLRLNKRIRCLVIHIDSDALMQHRPTYQLKLTQEKAEHTANSILTPFPSPIFASQWTFVLIRLPTRSPHEEVLEPAQCERQGDGSLRHGDNRQGHGPPNAVRDPADGGRSSRPVHPSRHTGQEKLICPQYRALHRGAALDDALRNNGDDYFRCSFGKWETQ